MGGEATPNTQSQVMQDAQTKIVRAKGIAALLNICSRDKGQTLVKALWALRTAVHGNNTARSEVTAKGGLQLLLQHAASKDGDIQEAALACLVTVLLGHDTMQILHDKHCPRQNFG